MKTQKKLILSTILSVTLISCSTMQRTDLYFGTNIPTGGNVTPQQWKAFTDDVITHYFPEGYTESDAVGKWMDTQTKLTISENTKVVTFLGKPTKERNAMLDSITQRYIRKFHQQSVLRVDSKPKVKFISKI
ncbi:DUF3574 domain-containing protein [Chryseobacterium paridis]|uniref:DUF3574 domain-containing protein n=1 Tax=Chryseobacterium paridis TaxID=2800328 RepID=A0ABS1FUB7_9FLAO|nr:DUF3574 domain-containing protein [Chryseobacterium paridis]MBK1896034.1 DUF3574 domain-containing protein [Chryseobacterium paridis]